MNFDYGMKHPFDYIKAYSAVLYPSREEDVIHYSNKICCDGYYTNVNLLYKPYVVAVASIILATKILKIPSVMDEDFSNFNNLKFLFFPPLNEREFNKELLNFDNEKLGRQNREGELGEFDDNNDDGDSSAKTYFDCLEWNKKVHQYLEIEDLSGK